jgi:hypothetical protein
MQPMLSAKTNARWLITAFQNTASEDPASKEPTLVILVTRAKQKAARRVSLTADCEMLLLMDC